MDRRKPRGRRPTATRTRRASRWGGAAGALVPESGRASPEAPGGEKYETPEWILKGYAWGTLPVMDEVMKDFNEEFGTNLEFQLKAMAPETE